MTDLRDRLQHRQGVFGALFLLGYLALAWRGSTVISNGVTLFAIITAYSCVGAWAWWWVSGTPGHGPDERTRAIGVHAGLIALYMFFIGALAITGWRIAHGQVDLPILNWLTLCTIVWVADTIWRSRRA